MRKTDKVVELIIFAGQSNMAGRGTAALAPKITKERAWEFRAVSDPTKLYPLTEQFGYLENNPAGIWEPGMKTGSMVTSFVEMYLTDSEKTVVALSTSKGGSSITEWQPGSAYYRDLLERIHKAKSWLTQAGYQVERVTFLWLQGETDGDLKRSADEYQGLATTFFQSLLEKDVDEIFVLEIGNQRDEPDLYLPIRQAQRNLGALERVTFVPTSLASMRENGHMIDLFHYDQYAYNLLGKEVAQALLAFNQETKRIKGLIS
ncbi:sialate O-acetylesterase [Enterococcus asini]|uniref:sialate O-acetylesterase n=1 Tax=Enterococcus asini TaxID=57732 RepID=UPI00241E4D8B|nr:sialate O-acetylesterase [Enterococcus asini]